jgi:hypothetical protein
MRPRQREQGYKRLLRGVRDEEVAGSNPVTPTNFFDNEITPVSPGLSWRVMNLVAVVLDCAAFGSFADGREGSPGSAPGRFSDWFLSW